MSEHWIVLIPENPRDVPAKQLQERARVRFVEIAPNADAFDVRISEGIEFVDCGGNFESVRCPACCREIPIDWWADRMDEDPSEAGYRLTHFPMPCCVSERSLNDLHYVWPQGFARVALEAMNPNIGMLDEVSKLEFEEILGTKIRIIHRHI